MEFKVDENLPVEVADLLRQVGYDAVTVFEQHLEGSPDSDIASICQQEGRALITLDTDFADISAYPPAQFPGLIVLRLHRLEPTRAFGALVNRSFSHLLVSLLRGWSCKRRRGRLNSAVGRRDYPSKWLSVKGDKYVQSASVDKPWYIGSAVNSLQYTIPRNVPI